ncbi:MAG TPA: hypothetical protein VF887_03425 [Gemmatimonadaceae bacterium]
MTTPLLNAIVTIQGTTPRPATTNQNPAPVAGQSLNDAAREFRDAIRSNVQQEIAAARAKSAAQAALAQDARPAAPTAPDAGRTVRIRGPDGSETIISRDGASTTVPPPYEVGIPPQAVDISIAFFLTIAAIIIGLPLARAFARRMDRRGGTAQASPEISSQLAHLNQAVDAIALEVERISEGQRFTTRLLSEQREASRQTLPSGANR